MSNREVELEQRRKSFTSWLLKSWDWATENMRDDLADRLFELVSHASEEDYPLWEMAGKRRVIGDGKEADMLREACGLPVMTPRPTGWEREINFCPVISLEPEVFQRVYNSLGWVNRAVDPKYPKTNFWLWSDAANMVRFVKREPVQMESDNGE